MDETRATPRSGRGFAVGFSVGLAVLVAIGLVLRLGAVRFGEPASSARPDEELVLSEAVLLAEGDSIGFFRYPPGLILMECGWLRLTHALGLSPPVTLRALADDPLALHVAARWLTVLLGGATVVVVGLLGRRLSGGGAGLFAAASLATAPLFFVNGLFVKPDAAGTLFFAASLWLAVPSSRGRASLTRLTLAAVAAGAATAIKYPCGVALLSVIIATWSGPHRARRLSLVGVGFVAAFFALAPTFVTDTVAALEGIRDEARFQAGPRRQWDGPHPLLFHLRTSLGFGVGFGVTALGLLGSTRRGGHRLLVIPGCVLLSLHAFSGNVYTRYMLPVAAVLAVLAGAALARGGVRFPRAATIVGVLVLALPAWRTAEAFRLLRRTDTRGELVAAFTTGALPRDLPVLVPGPPFDPFPLSWHRTYLEARAAAADPALSARRNEIERETAGALLAESDERVDVRPVTERLLGPTLASLRGRRVLIVIPTGFDTHRAALSFDWLHLVRDRMEREAPTAWRRLAIIDPTAGRGFPGREAWDPADYWFVPVTRPALVARPGPLIEVFELLVP